MLEISYPCRAARRWQGCDITIKPHLLLRHLPPSQPRYREAWPGQSNLCNGWGGFPGVLSLSLFPHSGRLKDFGKFIYSSLNEAQNVTYLSWG